MKTETMNYRIQARQRNDIVSNLKAGWASLGLPKDKCPTPEDVARKAKEGGTWYLFMEATGEHIYVSQTEKQDHPLQCLYNKFGRL